MPRWLQFALFLSVFMSIYGGCHFYVYTRVAAMLGLTSTRALWTLRIFFIVMALSFIAARMLISWQVNWLTHAAYWAACVWMGFALYLFFFGLAAHLLTGLLLLTGAWSRLENSLGFSPGRLFFVIMTGAALIASA